MDRRIIDIRNCSACAKDHDGILVYPITRYDGDIPLKFSSQMPTHFTLCPETGHTIFSFLSPWTIQSHGSELLTALTTAQEEAREWKCKYDRLSVALDKIEKRVDAARSLNASRLAIAAELEAISIFLYYARKAKQPEDQNDCADR